MKPYTKSTFGRDRYFNNPKDHRVPKNSLARRGTRTAVRQKQRIELILSLDQIKQEVSND